MWTAVAGCGRLAQRQRSASSLLALRRSTSSGVALDPHYDSSVSADAFTEFVRNCGLSKKRLHQQLYPLERGYRAPIGEFPLAVAVSGGADSMALMLLLREYLQRNHIKTPLLAVTVDHQLRLESSKEALEVAKICAERGGIIHVTRVCDWHHEDGGRAKEGNTPLKPVKPRDSKVEEQARQYRYDLLRQVCAEHRVRCLFVAHNLGDLLETTLFRLGRASGVNGLAGIANRVPFFSLDGSSLPQSPHTKGSETEDMVTEDMVTLVRPLLSVTKDQLTSTCERFEQAWIHDPSNDNPVYDRVRIRQELKRVEQEHGAHALELFSKFQQTAEKAKKEFARAERAMLRKYTLSWEPDLVVLRMAAFNDPEMFNELLYRVLSIIVMQIGNKETPPRLASVARLARDLQQLETGKQVTLGGCRIKRVAKGSRLEFQPERKRC